MRLFLYSCVAVVFAVNTVRIQDGQFDDLIDALKSVSSTVKTEISDLKSTLSTALDYLGKGVADIESKITQFGPVFGDLDVFLDKNIKVIEEQLQHVYENVKGDFPPSNCSLVDFPIPFSPFPRCIVYKAVEGHSIHFKLPFSASTGPYFHHGLIPLIFNNVSKSFTTDFYFKFMQFNSFMKFYREDGICSFVEHMHNVASAQAHIFRYTQCASEVAHYADGDIINVVIRALGQSITRIRHSEISDMYQLVMAHFDKSLYVNMVQNQKSYRFAGDASPFVDFLLSRRSIISVCNNPYLNCSAGSESPRLNKITYVKPSQSPFEYPYSYKCHPFGPKSTAFSVTLPESFLTVAAYQDDELRYETLALSHLCPEALREVSDDQDPDNVVHKYEYTVTSKPQFIAIENSEYKRLNIHRPFYPLSVVFHHLNGTTQPWLTSIYNSDPANYDFTPRCTRVRDTIQQIFYELRKDRDVSDIWDCGSPSNIHRAAKARFSIDPKNQFKSSFNSFPYYLSALKNDFSAASHYFDSSYFDSGPDYHLLNDSRDPVNLHSLGLAWFSVSGDSSAIPGYVFPASKDPLPDLGADNSFKTVVPAVRRVRSAVAVVNDAISNYKNAFDTIISIKETAEDVWAEVETGLLILGDVLQLAKKFVP